MAAVAAGTLFPSTSWSARERRLSMFHTHTQERLELTWPCSGSAGRDALAAVDHFLRDHYDGTEHPIDQVLLDIVVAVLERAGRFDGEVHVISGYRSPATNERLRRRSAGVARKSLHMRGMAIDLRVPGTPSVVLRDAALRLGRGGVGFYGASDFVHLDTGRVRSW